MPIAEGIAAAKAALDVTKFVTDLVNRPQIDAPEIQRKLHEMLIHIVNAQTALGEAQVEMSELRHKLYEREAWKVLNDDMDFTDDGHVFIKKSEQAAGRTVRYCPLCWKSDRKDIPLSPGTPDVFHCELHKSTYFTRAYHDKVTARNDADAVRARSRRNRHETIL